MFPNPTLHIFCPLLTEMIDFNNPQGSLKGIIAAAYSLGAILSLPFVPIVNEKFGRRWSIFGGSVIMCAGAILQGCAQNGKVLSPPPTVSLL